ncbi:polysaccharide deacetylase family protein [Pediococcus claussenii]|nr:polysaccharide deacetylase family protein [Pediococcus claussenii]ANZ70073.1 hypothetical protein AYR57_06970 [Pediococcus claussenii]ANZ71888.1 hypothetical protein AYR58_06970 [Pediococcus claussenii]
MKISKNKLAPLLMVLFIFILSGCSNTHSKKVSTQTNSIHKHVPQRNPSPIKWKHIKGNPNLPILMYHSISPSTNTLRIPSDQFNQQMKWLKEKNYYTLTPREAARVIMKHEVPNRPFIWITLDDGYENNYRKAFPVIQKYKLHATINFITSFAKRKNHLTIGQAKKMIASGNINIESHTVTHQDLDILGGEQQTNEMVQSKKWLDKTFNQDTSVICYPAGRINDETASIAKRAGYTLGITTQPGLANINQGQFNLKRIRIVPKLSHSAFFKLIQTGK